MSDPMKQAWSEVGDEFSSLGRLMKDRYQAAGSDAEAAVDDSTKAAGAALRDAWDRLVTAAKEVGDRTADVARDDELRRMRPSERRASSTTPCRRRST